MLGDHQVNMDWLQSSLVRQEEDKTHRSVRSRHFCFALMLLTSVKSLKRNFFSMILQKTKLLWNIRKMCVENRCRAIRMKIGFCCRFRFFLVLDCVRWTSASLVLLTPWTHHQNNINWRVGVDWKKIIIEIVLFKESIVRSCFDVEVDWSIKGRLRNFLLKRTVVNNVTIFMTRLWRWKLWKQLFLTI